MKKKCGNCRHLSVPADRDGKVRVRRSYTYVCLVDSPEVALPACITNSYGFRWPPHRTRMCPEQGGECPLHEVKKVP